MSYKTLHDIGEPIPVPGKDSVFVKVQVMEAKNESNGEVSAVLDIRTFANGKPQMGQGIVLRHPDMLDSVAKAITTAKAKLQAEQDRLNKSTNGALSKLSKEKKQELFKLLAADLGVSLDDDEDEDVDDDEEVDVLETVDADEDDDEDVDEVEEEDEEDEPAPAPKAKARKPKVKHIADVYEAGDDDELFQGLCECGWESAMFKTFKTAEGKVEQHLAEAK